MEVFARGKDCTLGDKQVLDDAGIREDDETLIPETE